MNRFRATVERCDRADTIAWLGISGGLLAARLWPGAKPRQKIVVQIRPEDVLLASGHPGSISARNVLAGHVTAIKHVPEGIYVTLDVGFPLTSIITQGALHSLRIERGSALYGILKATAIMPEAPAPDRYRISLVGKKGEIPPEKIEFLRAIERTGSMSGACLDQGITYRTAWMWVRAINRAWGTPLLVRVHGGAGGGGTWLTPEGRAALDFAASLEIPRTVGRR
ncbi:MAG TPA: TOBE domain-containing protein [Planctomycetota bacterium]|nr:TOBE domain-containing protein [Planctomycetota bacterium]